MKQPLFIKWHRANEVGIPLLDEQHRGIVSIINTFFHLMRSGIHNQLLYSCISEAMRNYTRIHFLTEESFLAEAGFEGLEKHKEIHQQLSLDIERMEQKSIRDNDPAPLLDFLKMWWMEHINVEDRQYSECLIEYFRPHYHPHRNR
ncbi:MAG: hemerythrin family protein [Desulfovibrio sp.]|jgi:hemerythrin-like metal-binding protein|nr:hemerythrin family protein [Desulfovibrio sp.]